MKAIKDILPNIPCQEHTQSQKTIKLQNPDEDYSTKREKLRQDLNVSSLDNTFNNFKVIKGTKEVFDAFQLLASGEADYKMVLCYGVVGNGKTHLCEALAIELTKRGKFTRVLTMAKIMRGLKNALHNDTRLYDQLLDRLCYAETLIIDDVGMGNTMGDSYYGQKDWSYGQLEEIIIPRYRDRLLTILTTNRDLTEIPERIVSRFTDAEVGRIVLNSAEDYRPSKGKVK